MLTPGELNTITTQVADLRIDDDISGRQAYDALADVLRLRCLADHLAAQLVGAVDRLGVATQHGRKTHELLIVMGCAPGVAARFVRIAGAAASLPTLMAHAADGAIAAEHVDAIVTGVAHIARRSPEPVDDEMRFDQVSDLLGQFFSGATPAEIKERAKALGNQLAAETDGGLPAAEDRSINSLTHHADDDGRLEIEASLDVEVGEKFTAAIEVLAKPRPEPDGSPDARSTEQRQADALEALLDAVARGTTELASAPRMQILGTVPVNNPDAASLEYMGSISRATLDRIMCDAAVTMVIVDGQRVPLDMSKDQRFFPAALRKALYLRDECCIKCGAPASRTHAHHMTFASRGGETTLDNGCLLCPACHADVHNRGWDVIMGHDRHPWLIPPASVDPKRRPLPAYNRRTMTLDDAA